MTVTQQIQRLRALLRARLWTGAGPGTAVFGATGVVIVPTGIQPWSFVGELRAPYALIAFAGATHDEEHPELLKEVEYEVTIVVDVSSDQFGEGTMVGAGVASANNSAGQGLLDVMREVHATLSQIDPATDGFRLRAKTTSSGGAIVHEGRTMAAMAIKVQAIGTTTTTA